MAVMAAVCCLVICAHVWSDRVWRDSRCSCKSSPARLLKMEQHTILSFVNLSSVFSLTSLSSSPPSSLCSPSHSVGSAGCSRSSLSVYPPPTAFCQCCGPTLSDRQRGYKSCSVTGPGRSQWPRLTTQMNWQMALWAFVLSYPLKRASCLCFSAPAVSFSSHLNGYI